MLPAVPFDYTAHPPPELEQWLPAGNEPRRNPLTDEGATLGRVLFYDRLLSRDHSRSCGSCHRQAHGFADGERLSRGAGGRLGRRNAMSLVNLRYRDGGFLWDARRDTLEEAVLDPIQNPLEMGLDLETLVARLRADPDYPELFRRAFGDPEITAERIARALAQFARALVSLRSRFDEGLARAGSATADFANFTAEENRGKRLFLAARSCASCHMLRMPGGSCGSCAPLSPAVFQGGRPANNGLDADVPAGGDAGRAAVTGAREDRGKFQPPSLRNVELTAPYMHDGRFATLDDVLRFYAFRVRAGPGLDARMAVGGPCAPDPSWSGGGQDVDGRVAAGALGFPMSSKERRALVAFLKTLTDRAFVTDPRFADPFR